MNFESKTELEARKAEKRKARELILDEAKRKYDIEESKIAAAKARGEDKWMLPELSQHLDKQSKKLKKKSKKLKKEKKKKREKKSKKEKTKTSSSSDSEGSADEQWVEISKKGEEKLKPAQETPTESVTGAVKGPVLQRDDWMTLNSADIPTISRQQLREKIKEDKLQYADPKSQPQLNIEEPGTHEKELNPYWKSGAGKGLPEEEKPGITVPKHNLAFLKQAYARCEKQAEESGESMESIAAERYGSLAQLEVMLMEAERAEELAKEAKSQISAKDEFRNGSESQNRSYRTGPNRNDRSSAGNGDKLMRQQNRSHSRERNRRKSRSRSRDRYRRKSRSRSRDRNRRKSRSISRDKNRRKSRSRSRDKNRRKSRSRSRDRYRRKSRSRSRDRYKGSRSRNRDRPRSSESKSKERTRYRSDRTKQESERSLSRSSSTSSSSSSSPGEARSKARTSTGASSQQKRFMKPGEMVDGMSASDKPKRAFLKPGESTDSSLVPASSADPSRPSWRRPGYQAPADSSKELPAKPTKQNKVVSPEASDSSVSSSEEHSSCESSDDEPEKNVPVALTDDEMNALGAKILKAELMGNEEMAKELKEKLEASRQARAAGVKPAASEDKEKVVVLSHADKFGNVRPVQSHDADAVKGGGKRRRARKAPTHNKSGERERYFADDDRFNIKDMVQAEKMTSAEDHHLMFSKMAAKVTEKIDDDNQIDDAMINRARLEHDPVKEAAKQQQQAHADSKQLAQTLDNCQYCLENMTKHLIVAVYKNTYLCLPEHQSLNEGHCRIIPIHHCMSSTSCDENVWNEVQEFRRALVEMFAANDDQDCVFMECSNNLRRHPHMVLECIPIERELGDMAPIYFKKAIDESEKEWAQNKKLVDLSKKDIRHSVPKGFPYFSVDFGLQGGFAHVIEDERNFPSYFGKEVVGGMMDVDPRLWRKPRKEVFEDQRKKVVKFAKMWKSHDFTCRKSESDSD